MCYLGYLGYSCSTTGVATISGPGSQWNTQQLSVGSYPYGSGTLSVQAGAQVNCFGLAVHQGAATIAGPGSQLNSYYGGGITIGDIYNCGGTLSVQAGAQVISRGFGVLGDNSNTTGVAIISGPGSQWTINPSSPGNLYVGRAGSGTLSIEGGARVIDNYGYLGFLKQSDRDGTGLATITGLGSEWFNQDLHVGGNDNTIGGSGTLCVQDGGRVTDYDGYVGSGSGRGAVTISGPGSQWTNTDRLVVNNGTLSVLAGGRVSSFGTIFYVSALGHSYMTTISGSGSMLSAGGGLIVLGSLNIEDGGLVRNASGGLIDGGNFANGVATISGPGSRWINSGAFNASTGTLNVLAGAQLSSYAGYVSHNCMATISGAGSQWINSGNLYIGSYGTAALQVSNGGCVSASTATVNGFSTLAIDVGYGSLLTVGSGAISNDGTVRMTAGPTLPPGTQYAPIAAATYSGTGAYTAIGGTWDPVSHLFTVSPTEAAVSGTPVMLDLASQQRVLVDDGLTGWRVGASLPASTGSASFTATAIQGDDLAALTSLLDAGQGVLGAWQFNLDGSGYSPGDPVYLSFLVGDGRSLADLDLWHWDGMAWSSFAAGDLSYNRGYANFTATSFSGYAVSAPVPEPSTLALLTAAAGFVGRGIWRRRSARRTRIEQRRLAMDRLEERTVLSGGLVTTAIGNANPSRGEGLASYLDASGNLVVAGRMYYSRKGVTLYDTALLRYTPNGALDPSFGSGGVVRTPVSTYNDEAYAAVNYPTNKILVAGDSMPTSAHPGDNFLLARYNADGSLDKTFGNGKGGTGIVTTNVDTFSQFQGVMVLPDNSIVAAGTTWPSMGSDVPLVPAHYTASGALDPRFGTNGYVIASMTTFRLDDYYAGRPMVLHDGKILVCGEVPHVPFGDTNGFDCVLAQYNLDGTPDTSFGQNGRVVTDFGYTDDPRALAIDQNDNIIVAGDFEDVDGGRFGLARYTSKGLLDTSFGAGGVTKEQFGQPNGPTPHDLAIDPASGKIVVVGGNSVDNTSYRFVVARFNTDGSLDTSFNGTGSVGQAFFPGYSYSQGTQARSVVIQPGGKIIATGWAEDVASRITYVALARYNADGTLDTSFGTVSPPNSMSSAAVVGGNRGAAFTVTASPYGEISQAAQAEYASVDGTATGGSNSLADSGTVSSQAGDVGGGATTVPINGEVASHPFGAASADRRAEAVDRVMAELSFSDLKVRTVLGESIAAN